MIMNSPLSPSDPGFYIQEVERLLREAVQLLYQKGTDDFPESHLHRVAPYVLRDELRQLRLRETPEERRILCAKIRANHRSIGWPEPSDEEIVSSLLNGYAVPRQPDRPAGAPAGPWRLGEEI
ncbi:MAG: hypothetical protein M3O15_00405 [Acidobacteriota bacterium]|nr:hypothetical protein [Acidobacteriota bacterium]